LRSDTVGKPQEDPEFVEEEIVAEDYDGAIPGQSLEENGSAGFAMHIGQPSQEEATIDTGGELAQKIRAAKIKGYEGDPCGECGQFTMVRNGTCLKCMSCGATSGCS
jgi:ribonucleoside-diphosphate reductase alpha chain